MKKIPPVPRTIIYWCGIFALGLIFLGLIRLGFLIRHHNLAVGIPVRDLLNAFLHGIRFDISILSYVVLPFFILSIIPFIGFEYSRAGRKIIQTVFCVLSALLFILALVDIEYYSGFGDHLGVWFYSYWDKAGIVWYTIKGYPIIQYFIISIATVAAFIYLASRLNRLFDKPVRSQWPAKIIYSLVTLALLAIGMRGSVTLAPLDWGNAYFSNYGFANDLSLNGVFTLGRSLYEDYDDARGSNLKDYRHFSHGEALKIVQDQIVMPFDSLVEPEISLKRVSRYNSADSSKYNVVIIVLESWPAKFVGSLGGNPDVTPFFDSLSQKSILFNNFYASGLRTNRGLLSVLCSFPSLPGRTVMKRYSAPHPFSCIADVLGRRGYDSYFIYGGDLGFDNMEGFFRDVGFKNFIGINDFPKNDVLNKWGVPDHMVFERANDVFSKTGQPFIATIVTLTNHEPFKLPDPKFEIFNQNVEHADYLNTFHYSDWALGHFFNLAEKESYFKNTIFVLVGDHGKILNSSDDMRENFRIACLIYCPGRSEIQPHVVNTACGQVDLLPTIFGLLGQPTTHESWGHDVLSPYADTLGFAFLGKEHTFAWVEGSLMYYDKSKSLIDMHDSSTSRNSDRLLSMQRKGQALLQLEVEMVHQRKSADGR